MIKSIGILLITNLWTFCNTYMILKKSKYYKLYFIYSTLIMILYIIFAWQVLS